MDSQRLPWHLQGCHTPMWHQPGSPAMKHIKVFHLCPEPRREREHGLTGRLREPHGTVHTYHTLALVNAGMHCTHVLTHVYTRIHKHTNMGSMGHVSVHVLMEASYRPRPWRHPTDPGHQQGTHLCKCVHTPWSLLTYTHLKSAEMIPR